MQVAGGADAGSRVGRPSKELKSSTCTLFLSILTRTSCLWGTVADLSFASDPHRRIQNWHSEKMEKKTRSRNSCQKDWQGSVSSLQVRIICRLCQIGTEEFQIGIQKKQHPRKVARKNRKGLFSPSGSVLLPACSRSSEKIRHWTPRKKCGEKMKSKKS